LPGGEFRAEEVGGVHHNQSSASQLGEIRWGTLRDYAALKNRLGKFPLEVLIMSNTYPIGIRIARL
jgi:hypothetical protein